MDNNAISVSNTNYLGTNATVSIIEELASNFITGYQFHYKPRPVRAEFTAKRVIFNPPATIVLWEDDTKTVVKCDDPDTYNPMLGVALCYMKKSLGNKSGEFNKALRNSGAYEYFENEE